MCVNRFYNLCLASFFFFMNWISVSTARSAEQQAKGHPKTYSSPTAVFDAFRTASNNGDWQAAIACKTKAGIEEMFFQVYSNCMTEAHDKVSPVMKKYAVDLNTVTDKFNKSYLRKHGIDRAAIIAARDDRWRQLVSDYYKTRGIPETPAGAGVVLPISIEDLKPPLPPPDAKLFHEVVSSLVTDKAAFCAEILIAKNHTPDSIGPLNDLEVTGDQASAIAVISQRAMRPNKPDGPQVMLRSYNKVYYFVKSKSGWLIDGED